jgi:hypothetical protein
MRARRYGFFFTRTTHQNDTRFATRFLYGRVASFCAFPWDGFTFAVSLQAATILMLRTRSHCLGHSDPECGCRKQEYPNDLGHAKYCEASTAAAAANTLERVLT